MADVKIPNAQDLLQAGAQFGHQTKRWNPKMGKYIFGEKNHIHIIDADKTIKGLEEAAKFLEEAASKGGILFVGSKKQASELVKEEAVRVGAFFINKRWAGGLFTNFSKIKLSLNKLRSLEKGFEEGVKDRTKYEVALMKKEWQKLNRLYSGIKTLETKPTAIVILDTNFEKSAVKEARKVGVPVVGIVDTNCDPDMVDYVIPANDDAIKAILLVLKTLGDAILVGNKGAGVKHELKDYSKVEVQIIKANNVEEEAHIIISEEGEAPESVTMQPTVNKSITAKPSTKTNKGILERVKEEAEEKKSPKKEKTVSKSVEKSAKVEKKEVKKTEAKKPVAKKEAAAKAKKDTKQNK
ncbi:MAG: 30S ribosomal protein S2 [Candidatus Dojkabacteria bacterium]